MTSVDRISTGAPSSPDGFDPRRLVEEHQAGVWRYLRALGCPPGQADDLTQETFLAVLKRPLKDYHPRATAAYLRRVAHHLLISQQRRAGRVTTVEDIEAFEAEWTRWAGDDSGAELLEKLKFCLQGLTDRARRALEMRYRDHASRAEIAAMLQISEHGAKNLMQRAKRQLRECIEEKSP